MKRYFHTVLLFVIFSFSHYAHGTPKTVDPLWEKVVAQHTMLKKWVAKDIEQIVLETPKGEATKKTTVLKQFARIEKAKPIYTVLETIPAMSNPKDVDQNVDFGAMFLPLEAKIFTTKADIKRLNAQVLDGKTLAVFEFSKAGFKLKLWVDPETGVFHQREFQGGMPFVMSGVMTTSYSTDPNTRNLPKQSTTKVSITVPFQKAEVEIKDNFTNWFELP